MANVAQETLINDNVALFKDDLERAVRDCNVARLMGVPRRINWPHFEQRSQDLGVDQQRIDRIILAAKVDLDWDETICLLENGGMNREDAEWVADQLAQRLGARRYSYVLRLAEERKQERKRTWLALSINGLVLVAVAFVLGGLNWSWLSSTAALVRQFLEASY